jgi:hypothetical protein
VIVTVYALAVVELNEHDVAIVPLAVRLNGVVGHVTVRPAGVTVELKVTAPMKF